MFSLQLKLSRLGWSKLINPALIFTISCMVVNGGNYLYNVILGRYVGPYEFAEVGLLVTLLLLMSFLGMTFQIAATKYQSENVQSGLASLSKLVGLGATILLIINANYLTRFFDLSSPYVVYAFAIGVPFYFIMSVRRGCLQGKTQFIRLSISYQAEMLVRFLVTFVLLLLSVSDVGVAVALGISVSIIASTYLSGNFHFNISLKAIAKISKPILYFFLITAGYEVIQALVNYFDLLLVKHHFGAQEAGFYTSLSIIGRIVYFVTWIFVMLFIPDVVNRYKEGRPYRHLLRRYLAIISGIAAVGVIIPYLFSGQIVILIFGEEYLQIAPFLWRYALATGLFAVSNVFVYYYLSLNDYKPVLVASGMVAGQVIALCAYHSALSQIVNIQVVFMSMLLVSQFTYHLIKSRSASKTSF